MTFQLNSEQERVVGQAIEAGLIRGIDEVVEVGVDAIRRRLREQRAGTSAAAVQEWVRELSEWSQSHARTPLLPDESVDRSSIYSGRE
jgi:hypothetical protein